MTDWDSGLSERRDEDLLRVARSRPEDGYEPALIVAAEAEIARRGLSIGDTEAIELEIDLEHRSAAVRADLPLSNWAWFAFVVFGVALVWALIACAVLFWQGYDRKAKDALKAIPLSLAFWGLVSVTFMFFG